ncbi:MAG TPA: HisA/HisF-related TIM barrel protein [Actinomycetota bacterium]|nr:HisA/HisF-related TIM barrel protein [Actinomycetota bacterium]
MTFSLLPAIDLTDGHLGVYSALGPKRLDVFDGDPLAAARAYLAAGARWLHVVDMDLAFNGRATNVDLVRAIVEQSGEAPVQASGGVRTWEEVGAFLEAGAARVVVSSAALADEGAVAEILSRARPGEVLIGIEVRHGRVRSRGAQRVDLDLMATLGWLQAAGAPGFLVTAVDRVGTQGGPDTGLVRRVSRFGLPTLAAGGIRSLADLAAVRDAGATGAVVGRSALDGSLDLATALAWACA